MQIVKDVTVKVPREEVLRLLKHKEGSTIIDQKMSDLINSIIDEGKKLSQPKAIYKDFSVKNVEEHSVILEGAGFGLIGKSIAHRLWDAKKVTLFIATIGPSLEKRMQELVKQSNISNAAILDAVGSAAVESVVNYVNELADTRAREQGFKTIKRFSPGYGDWDLKEQKGLLLQLNANQIGVTLTSGNLMQPEKSVSGVIGWIKG